MPWPQDNSPVQPQMTPGMALWNFLKGAVPSQLQSAGNLAAGVAKPFTNLFGNGGQEFWNGPQDPQAASDMRNALLTMYAGSATPGAAEMNPAALGAGMKVYRGSPVHETWPPFQPEPGKMSGPKNDTFWASTDPKVAATYADRLSSSYDPNVMPAEADFKNPLVVDAGGNDWMNIPTAPHFQHLFGKDKAVSSDILAMKARDAGHDGLILNNVLDDITTNKGVFGRQPKPATTIAALQPGTVKSPLTGETLFSGSDKGPNPIVAAMMAENQPQNAMAGIRAFHGSPYDFDRFDASKIGTGEGAQAYGHGLYFAESPGVAQSYRDSLERPRPSLEPSKLDDLSLSPFANYPPDAVAMAKDLLAKNDNNPVLAAKTASDMFLKGDDTARMANNLIGAYSKHFEQVNKGKMYEVNINADPASFLDWDKPLADQSPHVQSFLQPFQREVAKDWAINPSLKPPETTGQVLAGMDDVNPGWMEDHAGKLRELGIPGIRYLDQGSRAQSANISMTRAPSGDWRVGPENANDGMGDYFKTEAEARAAYERAQSQLPHLTHNYVVFPGNEHLIEIVKKYGIAGAAAAMGLKQADLSQMMGLVGPQQGQK